MGLMFARRRQDAAEARAHKAAAHAKNHKKALERNQAPAAPASAPKGAKDGSDKQGAK